MSRKILSQFGRARRSLAYGGDTVIKDLRLWIQVKGPRIFVQVVCDRCGREVAAGHVGYDLTLETILVRGRDHEHAEKNS